MPTLMIDNKNNDNVVFLEEKIDDFFFFFFFTFLIFYSSVESLDNCFTAVTICYDWIVMCLRRIYVKGLLWIANSIIIME